MDAMLGTFAGVIVLVLLVLVVGLFVAIPILVVRQRRARREFLEWARLSGWRERPDRRGVWWIRLTPRGTQGRLDLILDGERWGHPVSAANYHHTTISHNGTTTTSSTERFAVYVLYLPTAYPYLSIESRGLLSFGRGKIGDEAFDRRFVTRANPEWTAPVLLTPELRASMISGALPVWRLSGQHLVTSYQGALDPRWMDARVDVLVAIARLLPPPPPAPPAPG